jgi:hypothetical protein
LIVSVRRGLPKQHLLTGCLLPLGDVRPDISP